MTEKDINIEDEETLKEQPLEETDKEAEEDSLEKVTDNQDEETEDQSPLEKAQKEIEELKTQLLYKVAEFEDGLTLRSKVA